MLARTTEPLSGRRVAALTEGRVGQWRANEVLRALAGAGIVVREHRPPAYLYRLNRDHVAADGIIALAGQWETLLERIRGELAAWSVPPVSACLFGSAARGEAGPTSDIDVLLVREEPPPSGAPDDETWHDQVDQLAEHVRLSSGNRCEVLELTDGELTDAVARDDRLAEDLRKDAITLTGQDIRGLLRRHAASR